MTDKFNAIKALCPGATFGVRNDEVVWNDEKIKQPTDKEISDKIAELQAEYDAQEYARNRSSEYPTWQEQMDMQYHDAKNGTNTWQEAIEAVKTKYPKGE